MLGKAVEQLFYLSVIFREKGLGTEEVAAESANLGERAEAGAYSLAELFLDCKFPVEVCARSGPGVTLGGPSYDVGLESSTLVSIMVGGSARLVAASSGGAIDASLAVSVALGASARDCVSLINFISN